eukprot:Pompholyxophrys_sp_v1_NODE_1_length_32789_cov_6.460653.p24 type:complete len:173 gc:universal NODE_1_length_32789_cov_6.460653:17497-18015(+)
MTTYIFSEKLDKSKIAIENVKKYHKDRKTVVENYIKAILAELDAKILNASRKFGHNNITFNYSSVAFAFKTDKDDIVFNELKADEHAYILDSIVKALTKEGFRCELPENTYNSNFYKSYVTVHWNTQNEPLTLINADYAPNMIDASAKVSNTTNTDGNHSGTAGPDMVKSDK